MGKNQRSQIEMTAEEVSRFLEESRTCTMATVGPGGMPHVVAMWYGWIEGQVWLESKAKAQKVVNLRRDDRLAVMVEAGNTYETLRGVSLEGRGVIVEDPDEIWPVGVNVWERYTAPYTEECQPFVEAMLHKRVAVRLDVERTRTWDHRKLGMGATEVGGTTGPHIDGPGLPGPG